MPTMNDQTNVFSPSMTNSPYSIISNFSSHPGEPKSTPLPLEEAMKRLEQSRKRNEELREKLLRYILPITILTCGNINTTINMRGIINNLRSNLVLLPSIVGSKPDKDIDETNDNKNNNKMERLIAVRCDNDDIESTSELILQQSIYKIDKIINIWNSFNANTFTISSINEISFAIQSIKSKINNRQKQLADLNYFIFYVDQIILHFVHNCIKMNIYCVDENTLEKTLSSTSKLNYFIQLLKVKNNYINQKFKFLRAEIANYTYLPDQINQLSHISTNVHHAIDRVSTELYHQSARLVQYQALGPDFIQVVNEYVKLKQRLDQLMWSKKELGLV